MSDEKVDKLLEEVQNIIDKRDPEVEKIMAEFKAKDEERARIRKLPIAGKDEWDEVGTIGVDAGLCWVGDPCYIIHHNDDDKGDQNKELGKNWHEFCDSLWNKEEVAAKAMHDKGFQGAPAVQFNYDLGHPGLGVCVQSGYGDGSYPVYVRRNHEGRIIELKVVFADADDPGFGFGDDEPEECDCE
jgi:hypothetical protein